MATNPDALYLGDSFTDTSDVCDADGEYPQRHPTAEILFIEGVDPDGSVYVESTDGHYYRVKYDKHRREWTADGAV